MERLLTRLRNGETWLRETNEALLGMEHVGRDTEVEVQFLEAIALWDGLDNTVRNIYPEFEGCVLGVGKTCDDDAPIRCRYCGRTG